LAQQWSSRRQVGVYLAIVFTLSWCLGIGYWAFDGTWGSPASQAVALLFMMPPAFATLIIKGAILHEPVLETLGLKLSLNRWWLVAWLLPPLTFGLSVAIGGLLPGQELALGVDDFLAHFLPMVPEDQRESFIAEVRDYGMHPAVGMILQAMVAGMTINAVRGLGEELGWRGLMYREVRGGFYRKALIIGGVWGLWYAPIVAQGFRYPGAEIAGVPMCIAWCTLAGALALEIRERSGSVIPAAILYGTFEGLAKLPPLTSGGNAVTMGMYGLPGCTALALLLLMLRWAKDFGQRERARTA
jgi:hypothetical protein